MFEVDVGGWIYAPDEVVLHANLISYLALHIYILGLNAALVVDLGHEDLPGDRVFDFAGLRPDWKQSFELNAEGKSDKWIFDILL